MKEIILLKEGEIALKGLNKRSFEDLLVRNLRHRLKKLGKFRYVKSQSTISVEPLSDDIDLDEVVRVCERVFGVATLSRAIGIPKDYGEIVRVTLDYLSDIIDDYRTFKVVAKRSDKSFPMNSVQICSELGGEILERYPHLKVDVHNPQLTVTVEIRDEYAFVHAKVIQGAGGIPVGSSGRGLVLLSGGIDSPVAAYMMARRGIDVSAIHYVSPPYTSERAQMKVERLCEKLVPYCGYTPFYCVPFTEIQEAIKDNCPEELFTIIMRRLMMEIAQRIAERDNLTALITGESVGQVASQTMSAIICTDAACRMPVFRPVIGMDKAEIVRIAREIDTFDISIEPYEDCCTVFSPKHPKTRPVLSEVIAAQESFDFEPLIAKAVENTEMRVIK